MELLLVAGAVGVAGYAMGKRKERRQVANGYITYHDNGQETGQYANLHYGKTGQNYGYKPNHQHRTTTTQRLK